MNHSPRTVAVERVVRRKDRESRKATGRFYTPAALARYVASRGLAPLIAANAAGSPPRLRILDPAMGDGAMLRAAAEVLSGLLFSDELNAVLFGADIDAVAIASARHALKAVAFPVALTQGDMLAERPPFADQAGQFDAIVGNPPWGGWDRGLTPAQKNAYRGRFALAHGRIEPAALFIEVASHLLRPGGRLALVLPDTLLLKNYSRARRHLLDNYAIEEMVHWGRAFPCVNLDVFTVIATRTATRAGGSSTRQVVACYPGGIAGRRLVIEQSRFLDAPGHVFNLSLGPPEERLLQRIARSGALLGDWLEAHEGIHSGNMRARLFLPPGTRSLRSAPAEPLLFGRDEIAPYRLRPAGWRVIYDPKMVRRDRGEYAALGRREWYRPPKLLIRRTGDRLIAAIDRSGLFASNNLFVARPKPACPVPLEYIEAWLNSTLATWCFRAIQPRTGRIFAELKLNLLARIPAPRPPDVNSEACILALAARAAADPEGRSDLDQAFEEIAGLTAAERRMVHSVITARA